MNDGYNAFGQTPPGSSPTSWTVSGAVEQVAGYAHTAVDELEQILSIPKETAVAVIGAGAGGASSVISSGGEAVSSTWTGIGSAGWGLAALIAAALAAGLVLL